MKPVFIGDFAECAFRKQRCRQHKKAGHGVGKKSHAARAANQVVEPEAGRMIQSQMINLVIGVVPCPTRITHATSDRVGACGTKLLNGFIKSPVAGRSTASLPVRAQFTTARDASQAPKFLPREGSPAGDWFAPEEKARQQIDAQFIACGWVAQDYRQFNPSAGRGIALREYLSPYNSIPAKVLHSIVETPPPHFGKWLEGN